MLYFHSALAYINTLLVNSLGSSLVSVFQKFLRNHFIANSELIKMLRNSLSFFAFLFTSPIVLN